MLAPANQCTLKLLLHTCTHQDNSCLAQDNPKLAKGRAKNTQGSPKTAQDSSRHTQDRVKIVQDPPTQPKTEEDRSQPSPGQAKRALGAPEDSPR